ncbi:MAG: flagellar hook-basal body complex protein [Planctomycetes bacterium]|nr:flagellar hook-basal body complex protein [Planctomycetota bacterium]
MSTALFTALSSLKAHQDWIDVIGNNLANTNTPGFKGSRVSFADNFSRALGLAQGPTGLLGGVNPSQIGQGVNVGAISRNFQQGALTETGRTFDLAMQGRGFFALTNGTLDLFTRVGTFGLDAAKSLVDLATGYRVLGPTGSAITIDTDALYPPKASETVELAGNLPAEVTGPLSEVLTGASGLKHGYPATLAGTVSGTIAIPAGETWTMEVVVNGGAPQTVEVNGAAGGVTVASIAAAIDALSDVNATVNGSGFVELTSTFTGAEVTLKVNPGEGGKDLSSALGIPTTLVTGSEVALIPGVTTLNDLPANLEDYQNGDVITVLGVDTDGAPVNASYRYGPTSLGYDGQTVDEFVSFLNGLYTDATVSLNAAGQLLVEAQTPGESELLLSIGDSLGQAGRSDWNHYAASVTTQGTGPDVVVTSTEIYDAAGTAHTLTLEYERQADLTWNVYPSLLDGEGTVLSGPITGVQFDEHGAPFGLGAVNTQLVVQLNGASGTQTMHLDFGSDGALTGLTQFGSAAEVYVAGQDGYAAGELASISVLSSGSISGFYTNGQSTELGAVGVATFANEEGLAEVGDSLWGRTPNSGQMVLGGGNVAAAGKVVGGSLENSNVDTAEQFVRLIEAQRGYQASSRVISIEDEILAEAVNLI